jgi:hypothetical protein
MQAALQHAAWLLSGHSDTVPLVLVHAAQISHEVLSTPVPFVFDLLAAREGLGFAVRNILTIRTAH